MKQKSDHEIWMDQLVSFCPSIDALRKIASGEEAIHNETRQRAAAALCEDMEWGMTLEQMLGEIRRNLPFGQPIKWLPEATLPMAKIVDFFETEECNVEQQAHFFEAKESISQEDLRRATSLPFEISIALIGDRKVVCSGTSHHAYSKKTNPIFQKLNHEASVFLHTHPIGAKEQGSEIELSTCSWSDLRAAEGNGHSLIAHPEGLLKFTPDYEKAWMWMHKNGYMRDGKLTVSELEFLKQVPICCRDENIIEKEGKWGDTRCEELLTLLNSGQT